MALLYRAIWQDDRADAIGDLQDHFVDWLASKQIELDLPEIGQVAAGYPEGSAEIEVRRTEHDGARAVQYLLVEERGVERWKTTATSISNGDGSWMWIDLERVADDPTQEIVIAAPRLVRDLLDTSEDARVDQVRIGTKPGLIKGAPLAGLIGNENRSLPLIVFSHDPAYGAQHTIIRAEHTLRTLAGTVQVFVLGPYDEDVFLERIGEELSVRSGQARLYLPNRGRNGLMPDRHRLVQPARMERQVSGASRIFANILRGYSVGRRAPASYAGLRQGLREGGASRDADLLLIAEEEIERLRREREELMSQKSALEDELLDLQVEYEETTSEVADLRTRLIWRDEGSDPDQAVTITSLDISPESLTEAVARAGDLLSNVIIHPDAPEDLDSLDAAANGSSWAELCWRGLRALHIYADAGFDGDFYNWCKKSGHAWAWPATQKKLAMKESETVMTHKRFSAQRHLPVDESVEPSGRIHMWAHLKISEGGGRLAPRIYFYDDCKNTGLMHVGFIGPHHHMENTKTN